MSVSKSFIDEHNILFEKAIRLSDALEACQKKP